MRAFLHMARLLVGASPWAMMRGAALALLVWLMGAALLGLSGWFITAAGIAGLAGLGIVFDVFRPSAGVRFLALGRTIARYGERLLTHDATLRAVAALRVTLLKTADRARHPGDGGFAQRNCADPDCFGCGRARRHHPAIASAGVRGAGHPCHCVCAA
jgi:ATP-binding cassette subfamily C protein CydC